MLSRSSPPSLASSRCALSPSSSPRARRTPRRTCACSRRLKLDGSAVKVARVLVRDIELISLFTARLALTVLVLAGRGDASFFVHGHDDALVSGGHDAAASCP